MNVTVTVAALGVAGADSGRSGSIGMANANTNAWSVEPVRKNLVIESKT